MPALRIRVGLVVNPRIQGFCARLSMDARSAPSAKIFTPREESASDILQFHAGGPQDPFGRLAQRVDAQEGPFRLPRAIAVIDENGLTSGGVAGLDIAPAGTHHEARRKMNVPGLRGLEQQAWFWLATLATVKIVVR